MNENDNVTRGIDVASSGKTAMGADFGTLNETFSTSLEVAVDVTDGSGTTTYNLTTPTQPGLAFIGFTSDTPITNLSFTGVYLVIDNVTTGQALPAVPEPSSIALVCAAIPMVLGLAWKRRRKAMTA